MKGEEKYGFIKSLVFTEFANIACSLRNNHFVYTFTMEGILNPPWYIVGLQYEPLMWDQDGGTIDKIFNWRDPLVNATVEIALQSTSKVMGDDMRTTISSGTWLRFKAKYGPGLYDMSPFPIVVSETVMLFIFDVFFDPSLTITQLYCLQNLTIHIGTDQPDKLRQK